MAKLNQYETVKYSRIYSLGAARGDLTVTNDDIAGPIDSSDEWIRRRTGIVTSDRLEAVGVRDHGGQHGFLVGYGGLGFAAGDQFLALEHAAEQQTNDDQDDGDFHQGEA